MTEHHAISFPREMTFHRTAVTMMVLMIVANMLMARFVISLSNLLSSTY